ncbi:MAG TPA: hypothetical protein VK541_01880 [Pedobacter sp.]|uniref:hypothetical protein n=1 Tax=Pedobacter sp. TaxID=1411316 RepID=UPI002B6B1E5F|nr:hypothetical protein [Pedobacter sp.]HMI01199.1 hypothetical protein [Pedobacter sp.]
MKTKPYLLLPFASMLFFACNNQAKHPQADLVNQYSPIPETEQSILQYADSTDTQQNSMERQVSLIYQLEGLTLYVEKLSWNGKPALYIEHTSDQGLTDRSVRYYFKEDSLLLIRESIKRTKAQETVFEEKRTYLRNNTPFRQERRLATSASSLQTRPFTDIKPSGKIEDYTEKLTLLNDALAGQNRFETVFDQYMPAPEGQYLLLKSKIPGGYNASLLVKEEDVLIDSIKQYPSLFKDAKLNLKWEINEKEAIYVPVAAKVTSASGLNR